MIVELALGMRPEPRNLGVVERSRVSSFAIPTAIDSDCIPTVDIFCALARGSSHADHDGVICTTHVMILMKVGRNVIRVGCQKQVDEQICLSWRSNGRTRSCRYTYFVERFVSDSLGY